MRPVEALWGKNRGPNIDDALGLANETRGKKANEKNERLRGVIKEIMEDSPHTNGDIAQALNLRGIKTNRGCQFTPTHIHRLLKAA